MTPRQRECLNVIRRLTVDGVPPSYEEIKLHMGLASKSGVYRLIHAMRERGVLALSPHRNRSVVIRNEHAEAIPFDVMADAVSDLIARGGRVYQGEIRAALVNAYAGAPQ